MALAVVRADITLYAFDVSKAEDTDEFTVKVTWRAPIMGGYSYVEAQPYTAVALDDIVIDTEGLLVLSDSALDAAGWTISGDAPVEWITA